MKKKIFMTGVVRDYDSATRQTMANEMKDYICQNIVEACKDLKLKKNKLLFEKPLPKSKEELFKQYPGNKGIIMGETDDYYNACHDILKTSLNENIFIYSSRNGEIEHIINDLYRCQKKMVIIGSISYQNPYILDSLTYSKTEDIIYLLEKMADDNNSDFYLLIEDLNTLLAYDEAYLDLLLKILSKKDISKYHLLILSKSSLVNFKLLNHFKHRYAIEIYDYQDVVNIFGKNSRYKAKSYFFKEEAVPCVACKLEKVIVDKAASESYIKKIPFTLKHRDTEFGVLIGIDLKYRKEIYLSHKDRLLISSYDEEKIKKYQLIFIKYPNIEISLYNDDLLRKGYSKIIWLGKDIDFQKLFYFQQGLTMLENDAYYLNGIRGYKIKMVDE